MWLLVALLGAVAASGAINLASGNFDGGEDLGGRAADPGVEPPDEEGAEAEGELIDYAQPEPEPEPESEPEPEVVTQPEDEMAEAVVAKPEPPPAPVVSGLPRIIFENEPGAERDPWLDGWTDYEYVSTDEPLPPPTAVAVASAAMRSHQAGIGSA